MKIKAEDEQRDLAAAVSSGSGVQKSAPDVVHQQENKLGMAGGRTDIGNSASREVAINPRSVPPSSSQPEKESLNTGKSAINISDLPTWISIPPADTADYYYGVGAGYRIDVARRNALRDIASKIRVSISGAVQEVVSERNREVDRFALTRVTEEVQKVEIKDYSVISTAAWKDMVYVLVRVNRKEFINDTKVKIATLYNQIENAFVAYEDKSVIDKFILLRRQSANFTLIQGYYKLLKSDDLNDVDQNRISFVNRMSAQNELISTQMSFYVKTKTVDRDVSDVVLQFLAAHGVRAKTETFQASAMIEVIVRSKMDDIQGTKLAKLDISLVVKDSAQQIVARQSYTMSGASVGDSSAARQQAVLKFQEDLEKRNIVTGLGFGM